MHGRVYVTGDCHGDFSEVLAFCRTVGTTKEDLLIVLGDNGVNYFGPTKDASLKEKLEAMPISFFMIKGNHDQRPNPKIYHVAPELPHLLVRGTCLVEAAYPSLLFAPMFGGYEFLTASGDWKKAFVLGGAYSVDKWWRLDMQASGYKGYRWFADEQMTNWEMKEAESMLRDFEPAIILSHTCPARYIPHDAFLSGVDQSTVDRTMEQWMDGIELSYAYEKWYCGHWHTDRRMGQMRFMYHDIVELE